MSRVDSHLPGLKRRHLPRIAGTGAVDLAPLAQERPILTKANINTGKDSYRTQAVAERLESRAAQVQQPIIKHTNAVVRNVANERRQWVDNKLNRSVDVSVGGVFWTVDAGRTQQPRSVALAFEQHVNDLHKHQMILREGVDGQRKGRPDVEDMRETLQYYADMDNSI